MRKKRKSGDGGFNIWRSYSDVMAGVLLLFILIMSLTLFQAQKSYDESIQERDEKLALQAEYTADLLAKQNTIEEQEGTIKTKDEKLTALAQTLAEQEAKLKEQQALLNQQQTDLDEKTTQLSEQQTKIDNIIGVKAEVVEALQKEFQKNNINVNLDSQTGALTLDASVLFDVDESELTDAGKEALRNVLPIYCKVLLQKDYKNLQGRSAVLDCVARDSDGKQMDVEIQQDNEGASPKRARYHSGLMDMNTLNPGQDFDELPESYVIFITRDDVLGYGLPIYHVNRKIEEVSENFKDEAHIIYVNSKKQDDTELGRLMHDLHCKNAGDMHSKILADRVHELKETQKGVEFMCREMEQIYSEGIESGEMQKAKETTIALAEMGLPADKIAKAVKIGVDIVQKWIDESMSVAH